MKDHFKLMIKYMNVLGFHRLFLSAPIMDDRNVAAGMQFADADLLGIPVRIIVSKRNVEKGELELATRDKKIKKSIKLEDVEIEISEMIHI